jgi:nucleotide-binding universal stress UspA family protein
MHLRNRVAVVGVDLGCTGDDALIEGLRLAAAGALSKLHLVYAVDPKSSREATYEPFENQERALAHAPARVEQRAASLCRVHGLRLAREIVVGHARIGEPATTLLQMCADYDADLLIVGTHGRTGLDRVLDGSVAEAVSRHAHCPVLVARRKDYLGIERTVLPDPPYAPGEAPARYTAAIGHTHEPTTLESWHPSDNGPTGFRVV